MKRLLILAAVLLVGCKSVAPGSDPLVVRTEQLEVTAYNTFDTFLKLDDAAMANPTIEAAWKASAHPFAVYLRQPITVGTNTEPFGVATVLSLDTIKLAYKAGSASSNSLVSAITVLTTTIQEANQYTNLLTSTNK